MNTLVLILLALFLPAKTVNYPCDSFKYGAGKNDVVEIWSVSHGSIVIKVQNHSIFIDPVMQLGETSHPYTCFKPFETGTILITHEHLDHLSKATVDYLTKDAKKGSFMLFGSRESVRVLKTGHIIKNGDSVSLQASSKLRINVTAVPAYNTTDGHTKYHQKGTGNGYLIGINGFVIYVAGDTEVIPEMNQLGHVDVAFLPVNQPYTMTPDQCVEAAGIIKPVTLIPYHMGDTDMSPVIEAFRNSDIKVIIHEELR